MSYLIKGGRIVCPKNKVDMIGDLLIEEGVIKEIATDIKKEGVKVIDAKGKLVMPGIVDIHSHMRTPGFEFKEDLVTGSNSAVAAGITTTACMPNTNPALDNPKTIQTLLDKIDKDAIMNIKIIGAITNGIQGEILAPLKENHKLGVVGFSDDGRTTMNDDYMIEAFKVADECGVPIITHSEDHTKSHLYVDEPSPPELEHTIVKRDIELCASVNGRLHVCHVSAKESVEYVRAAKAKNIRVTCEVTPHHFSMCQEDIDILDPYTKVNPPIRSKVHLEAMIEGIVDGTIDVIATDHAPHEIESKEKDFAGASFGFTGFETSFALSYTNLVKAGHIDLNHLIAMMTYKGANLIGLDAGTLGVGKVADVTIADLNETYTIDPSTFHSKGKNTPFAGKEVTGKVTHTFVGGLLRFKEGNICR